MESSLSPITLSSSRSSAASSSLSLLEEKSGKCKSKITIESSDYGHMHLGWKRRNKVSKCLQSNSQLSNIQKVANWIKSIEQSNTYNVNAVDCENATYKNDSPTNNGRGEKGKGFVVIKCDYMKPKLKSQSQGYNQHLNTMNCSKNNSQTQRGLLTIPSRNETSYSKKKRSSDVNFIEKMSLVSVDKESYSSSIKLNDEKSDVSFDSCEFPKSVEIRKKELCTYLKLMDPSDKKEILALQNRRSTRVRNLAALRERINLEKEIKETTSETLTTEEGKNVKSVFIKQNENNKLGEISQIICRTSNKSPNETNSFKKDCFKVQEERSSEKMNIQNCSNQQSKNAFESTKVLKPEFPLYSFPPVKHVIKIQNFDNVMKKLIPQFKISLAKINGNSCIVSQSLQCNNSLKNKENIQCMRNEDDKKESELESYNTISVKVHGSKNPKETSNKIKFKSKTNIISFKRKKQFSTKKNIDKLRTKICNVKLRSTKFKIRLKQVPTEKDLIRHRRKIKKKLNRTKHVETCEIKDQLTLDLSNDITSSDKVMLPKEKSLIAMHQSTNVNDNKLNLSTTELENGNGDMDFQKLMMDINDFKNLTEEHKKCLIESRLLMKTTDKYSSNQLISEEVPPLYGFSTSDVNEIKLMCEIFEESILKHSQTPFQEVGEINQTLNMPMLEQNESNDEENDFIKDHNYISLENQRTKESCCISAEANKVMSDSPNLVDIAKIPSKNWCVQIDPNEVEENNCTVLPFDRNVEIKSLQKSLNCFKKKKMSSPEVNICHDWDMDSPKPRKKKMSHFISISEENGVILRMFYMDFNLVICQEFIVSFWMQTPLGNVLGSQDMWIPRGNTQRLMLNNKCIQKESKEMLFCSETNVAYVELWTKEHKSDIREGPVADIFVTIYFWKQRQNGVDKKVLQLENINGFAEDVQYCVTKSLPKIIVSWHVTAEDNVPRTFVHAYQLSADYQMVSYISEIEPVDHYVSSLHNIEGSDNLIVGCGETKITLWNVEFGHKVATIELSDVGPELSTLWVKSDRGFLFAVQQCGNKELRLIAINGINHSWKKLASYFPSEGFDELKGVGIENGLLLSFYDKGILCWKAETGEPVEEVMMDTIFFTSGNHVIFLEQNKVSVRHSLTYLLSISAEEQ